MSPYVPPTYLPPSYTPGELDGSPFDTTPFDAPPVATSGPRAYPRRSVALLMMMMQRRAAASPPPAQNLFDIDLQTYLAAALGAPVYPGHIPQLAPLPAYSFFKVSTQQFFLLSGQPSGLVADIYQFDIWSLDYLEAARMELALENTVGRFRGLMGTTQVNGVRLQTAFSLYETDSARSDDGTYHIAGEYRITRRQPTT